MKPYEVYITYLAMKKHFTTASYSYHKYNGKVRASESAFLKRRDRYFFERMSRKLSDDEIKMYFVSSFIASDTPSSVWVGEIIQSGERHYKDMTKRLQSLSYNFSQEASELFDEYNLGEVFDCAKGHPPALKKFLADEMSIETLTILDIIFGFSRKVSRKLNDPVWDTVNMKIKKYKPFISIDTDKYKGILRGLVNA